MFIVSALFRLPVDAGPLGDGNGGHWLLFYLSCTIKDCQLGFSLWSVLPLPLSVYSSAGFGESCAQSQIPRALYRAAACWGERERRRLDHRMLELDWRDFAA